MDFKEMKPVKGWALVRMRDGVLLEDSVTLAVFRTKPTKRQYERALDEILVRVEIRELKRKKGK